MIRTGIATRRSRSLAWVLALGVHASAPATAQTPSVEYSRQSDVIYGRKFGLALTMEVLVPADPNGLGVVWVVSSSGKSSREHTLQPSFERRLFCGRVDCLERRPARRRGRSGRDGRIRSWVESRPGRWLLLSADGSHQ